MAQDVVDCFFGEAWENARLFPAKEDDDGNLNLPRRIFYVFKC